MFDSREWPMEGGEVTEEPAAEAIVGGDAEAERFSDGGPIPAPTPFSPMAPQPTASDRAYGARSIDTEPADFDVAAAEHYNREHIPDVVRFDRATHGQFARGDGQLDARRIAAWQHKHHLPENGRVTENSCLVAEGKPRLPANNEPHDGAPMVLIDHPHGETFAVGARIPLAVSVAGPPGPVRLDIEVAGQEDREVEIELGYDGQATLDLPFDAMPLPGTREVAVSGMVGGEQLEARSSFDLAATGIVIPPRRLAADPSLPDPSLDRHAIDQAKAEEFNREHVANVVRFDRATRGYFAKPNGELDALAVAEWQTEHSVSRSGMVDELTAKTAETEHGGLDPEVDPRTLEHGPPQFEIFRPADLSSIDPMSPLCFDVHTRGNVPVEADWALVEGGDPIEMGSATSITDASGRAIITDIMNKSAVPTAPPRTAQLQVEVTSPLGTSPLRQDTVNLKPK